MQEHPYLTGQMILVDKPLEWTSFDVVNKIRRHICKALNIKKIKVGHAGTLDPLATGLLIICTGKKTKSIQEYTGMDKSYEGVFKLGATTPSYDLETEIDNTFPIDHITDNAIVEQARKMTGALVQIPPQFSAVKVAGKRAYELARIGEEAPIKQREVTVSKFETNRTKEDEVQFSIDCSKGTFIRSIAHDFGKALNSGAHLAALRRTAIGPYKVNDAIALEALIEKIDNN